METIDIIKLVGAIVIGYALLFLAMRLFKRSNKSSREEKNKKKK